MLQIDTRGQVDWAFPKNSLCEYSTGSNPVPANTTVKVPEGEGAMFFLDDHAGIEHVYVVATTKQWNALEAQLADLSRSHGANAAAGAWVDTPLGLSLRGIGGITSDNR